jgi:sec-independent protein translocase protein TatA
VFAHWWELALVLILALVFFGPKRLPEIGGAMGKGIREFKKATTEVEDKVNGNDQIPGHATTANQQTEVRDTSQVRDVREV